MLQLTLDFQKLMHTFDAFLDSCLTECSRKVPLDGKDAGMDALFKLVFTKLSCKCSPRIGKLLSKLVVELLKKACSRDRAGKNDEGDREFFSECFVDSLDFYTRFNPSISASDMLVSKSEVLEGICMTLSSTGSVSFPAKLIDPPLVLTPPLPCASLFHRSSNTIELATSDCNSWFSRAPSTTSARASSQVCKCTQAKTTIE